jgi:hypothetical protein
MKWIQILLILFLTSNLPLLQTDQDIGINGLICEDAVLTKLEKDDPSIDPDLWFNLRISSYSFNRVKSFFQLKSRFSSLFSRLQGVSPFWRPPPCL